MLGLKVRQNATTLHEVQSTRRPFLRLLPVCKASSRTPSDPGRRQPPAGSKRPTPAPKPPVVKSELDKCYLGEAAFPTRFIGPLEVIQSPGAGRGLAVVEDVEAGQLLIASQPFGVVYTDAYGDGEGDEDEVDDEVERLQAQMAAREYTPYELAWFNSLYDGTSASLEKMPDLKQVAALASDETKAPLGPEEQARLSEIIDLNYFEDTSEDEAMAKLRRLPDSRSPMGVWPEPSLINHSCSPNVAQYVFQDTMFVRAAQPLKAGTELTSNYLTNMLLAPVDRRRAVLQDVYDFTCQCPRCKMEAKQGQAMQQMVADIYEATNERLSQDLGEAIAEADTKAVRNIRNQLVTYVELLDAALTKQEVPADAQVYMQASVFDLYMLLGFAMDFLDEIDPLLYQLLQALSARIQPGSDTHIYWSGMLLDKMEEVYDEGSPEAKDADELCYEAFATRYGPVSRALYQRMYKARITENMEQQ